MAKKIHKIKPIVVNKGNMRLELGTKRLNRNLNDAQYALDSAIMTSMVPFMPMYTGQFIDEVKAKNDSLAGSGEVYAATGPYGRYLYEGYVMVDSKTGKGPMLIPDGAGGYNIRWKKGVKLRRSDRKLSYYRGKHQRVQSHWFEAAEKKDSDKWMKVIDEEMSKP